MAKCFDRRSFGDCSCWARHGRLVWLLKIQTRTSAGWFGGFLVGRRRRQRFGGGDKAMLTDITFAEGKVGRAFVFNGKASLITVPASESLAVSNLTLAAWIFPTDLHLARPIIDYGGAGQASNIHLWINTTGGYSVNPGGIHALVRNASGGGIEVDDADPVVKLNKWNYVVFTFNLTTGTGILYCNGTPVMTNATPNPINCISFQDVNFGYRNSDSVEILGGRHFVGKLDQISIYNRPLSASEIESIYSSH